MLWNVCSALYNAILRRMPLCNSNVGRKLKLISRIVCIGSERVGRSEATGDRLEEAKHINRSLSALGDVMAALAQRNTKHVPFRNSKLTQLLQDSLCGQAKAMMFIHIAPEVQAMHAPDEPSSILFTQSMLPKGRSTEHCTCRQHLLASTGGLTGAIRPPPEDTPLSAVSCCEAGRGAEAQLRLACCCHVQESSHGESVSTLGFGARVSEITLGAAKRNTESGAIFDAKEAVRRAEQEAQRSTREVMPTRPGLMICCCGAHSEADVYASSKAQPGWVSMLPLY